VTNFHSSGLRQKVDQLMDILYAGGVNNPMDSIEQISYLLFLRLLTERDEQLAQLDKKYKRIFSGNWAQLAWGNFVTLTGDQLFDAVRNAIEKLHELPGMSSTGKLLFNRATLKIYDRPALRAVVQGIHEMDLAAHNGEDLKGDMYEYLLSRLSMSGTNGQFRTPRHIIALIVDLVDPKPGQRICDPACGTAGFLIAAFDHIRGNYTSKIELAKGHPIGDLLKPAQWKFLEDQAFTGYDNDANMVKIGILNLYLHQLEKASIDLHNPLTTGFGAYPGKMFDCILANPPFSGKVQEEGILSDLNHKLNTRATELLFLKWFIDHLTPNGRAGVIVPNGVLFGSTGAAKAIRGMLLDDCNLQAVVTMPAGVFKPYAGVATAILIFQKGGPTKSVWFYEITADGFSLSDTRTPVEENDIPDILQKWPGREEGLHSFRVSRAELAKYEDVLTPGRYREQQAEAVIHDSPNEIIADMLDLEEKIVLNLRNLQKSLVRK
jgi:type I restriction enzyme M protein